MRINERSYSGKIFRPQPEIYCEEDGSLCLVVTPWGPRSSAKKVIQSMQDFFLSAHNDREATSPFQRLSCLSPIANNLRVAIMLANDMLYREDNKDEYTSGVEIFACARTNYELVWTQIGMPNIYLDRGKSGLRPLSGQLDLTSEFTNQTASPLPQNLLGLANTSNFSVQSMHIQDGDRLVLLSTSQFDPHWLISTNGMNMDNLVRKMTQKAPELPFWIATIET